MEMTFSDIEMRFILAEMIKASSIDVSLLVDFIQTHHLEQNWFHMQLPVGRNLSQCMGAAEQLFPVQFPAPPNPTNLKRKSLGEISEEPTKRQAITTRTEPPLTQRNIQPRPPSAGYAPIAPASGTPAVTASGKKRGRPSKADKEAQARAGFPRNITPAPLAPLVLAPQRAYASSPRYEVSNGCADPRVKKHEMDLGEAPVAPPAYPPPPASSTGVPRALPEPMDQVEDRTRSPPERGPASTETRSPAVPPHRDIPHTQTQYLPPHPLPQPNAPLYAAPRHPPLYSPQPMSRPDPIFPDRDRNRGVGGHMARKTPPALSPTQI